MEFHSLLCTLPMTLPQFLQSADITNVPQKLKKNTKISVLLSSRPHWRNSLTGDQREVQSEQKSRRGGGWEWGWITGHRRMSDSEAVIQTQMFGRVVVRRLAGTFSAPAVTQPWHREAAGRRRSSPAGRTVQCIMTKKSMLWCHLYVCSRGGASFCNEAPAPVPDHNTVLCW